MAKWNGKSRGSVSGIKVFVFFIKNFGLRAAYLLLSLPVPYFVIAAPKASRALFYYFHRRLEFSVITSVFKIFQTYYVFGQSLIDRVAVTVGKHNKFTMNFDGIHHIKELIQQKKGGILFTAHIGNFNISRTFFEELGNEAAINMVVTDHEHKNIKNYLESVTGKTKLNLIVVKEDLSHLFQINEALNNNELLVFAADRSGEGKHIKADFLGEKSRFFEGPFKLAALKKLPTLMVYIMREPNYHYHFYARKLEVENHEPKEILKGYLQNLEKMVKKYPTQWFNFYDFWY
tara:strand:- start:250 stop:1116 length:867 start_codon:yes stop_codon:yes gene_type:complete